MVICNDAIRVLNGEFCSAVCENHSNMTVEDVDISLRQVQQSLSPRLFTRAVRFGFGHERYRVQVLFFEAFVLFTVCQSFSEFNGVELPEPCTAAVWTHEIVVTITPVIKIRVTDFAVAVRVWVDFVSFEDAKVGYSAEVFCFAAESTQDSASPLLMRVRVAEFVSLPVL